MNVKLTTLFFFVAVLYILGCSSNEDVELPRFENKYYYVVKDRVTWFEALASCNKRNMQLLSIESLEENEFLNEYLRKDLDLLPTQNIFYWTAAAKFAHTGEFYWSGTGNFINFTNWSEDSRRLSVGYDFIVVRISGSNNELKWSKHKSDYLGIPICEKVVDFPYLRE